MNAFEKRAKKVAGYTPKKSNNSVDSYSDNTFAKRAEEIQKRNTIRTAQMKRDANDWLNQYNKLLDDVNEIGFSKENADKFNSLQMGYDRVSGVFTNDARKQLQDSFTSIKDYFGGFTGNLSSVKYPEQIDYRRADLQKSYQDALDEAIEANPGVSLHNLPFTDDMKFIREQMDELDAVEKKLDDMQKSADYNRSRSGKFEYDPKYDSSIPFRGMGRYTENTPSIKEPDNSELERAKEEYEAAYAQYQIAEENYYSVPDGDFQKAEDDYLAADTRLAEAEERVKQAEQDLEAQKNDNGAASNGRRIVLDGTPQKKTFSDIQDNRYFREKAESGYEKFNPVYEEYTKEKGIVDSYLSRPSYLGKPGADFLLGTAKKVVDSAIDIDYMLPSDDWTQEEKDVFAILYDSDIEKAQKFAIDVNEFYNRRNQELEKKEIGKFADAHPFAATAWGVGTDIIGLGMEDISQAAIDRFIKGTIPTKKEISPFQAAQEATGRVAENLNTRFGTINEKIPVFGGRGVGDAYQLLISVAESASIANILGTAGTDLVFFGNAAASALYDAKEKDATDDQALTTAVIAGAAEALGEHFSASHLLEMTNAGTIKAFFGSLFGQAFEEGEEELFTSIVNNLADNYIMQDKSNFQIYVKKYMEAHPAATKEEAEKEAWKNMWSDMAFDFVGGFASGGIHTGMQAGVNNVRSNIYYKNTYGDYSRELVQEGLESPEGTQIRTLAEKYQQKLDTGKGLSGRDLRRLVNANEEQFAKEDTETGSEVDTETGGNVVDSEMETTAEVTESGFTVKNADGYTEIRFKENPSQELAAALEENGFIYRDANNAWYGRKSTEEARKLVLENSAEQSGDDGEASDATKEITEVQETGFTVGTDSEHGTTVISFEEVPPKEVQAALKENGFKFSSKNKVWYGQQSQEEARRIVLDAGGELYEKSEQLNSALPAAQDDSADTVTDESITGNSDRIATKKAGNDSISKPFVASEEPGATIYNMPDGSSVDTEITGIASNEPGKLMLNVAGQEKPVRASDISYADIGEASLYYYVNEMELMPAAANMIVEQAKNAVSGMEGTARAEKMKQFSQSIYGMYSLGKFGIPQGKAMSSQFAGQLGESMAEVGYQLGRRIYQQNVQAKEATKQQRAASQRARAVTGGNKINGVQYDGLTVRQGKDGGVEIDGVTLNEQQKAGIRAAELLAPIGVNVHVFQSRIGADGKPVGENGSYSMKDGSIHIDLNAGKNGQGVMAYTIAHELTHFMEDQQPEQFRIFTDALFDALDMEVEAEIANKAEELKRQQPNVYQNASEDKLMADARSEVIAEACETMLTDTDAAQRIAQQIQQQNASLWEKIVQWFKDLSQKLRDAYNGLDPDSEIAMDAKKTIQQVDGLVQMWADLAVDAGDNYSSGEANGQILELSDSRTAFSVREEEPPKKTGIAYKVFFAKDGKLYPPMVANPGGADTPIGVWLNADVGTAAPPSKTGRMQVKAGGKGTQGGSGSLAFRPGWHLGDVPRANQFARLNPETGVKDLFPSNFVWAECEYAMDVDYQDEAMSYGYTENGKFRHSYAGLPRLPVNGYYRYRTNPNPDTVPWVITGAMKVNRILDDAEVAEICRKNGVEPMLRQGGDIDLEKLGFSDSQKKYSLRDIDIERDFINYGDTEAEKNAINRIADDLEARGKFISVTDAQVAQHIDVDRLGDYKAARAYLKEILKDFMGDSVYFEYNGNFAEAYLTKDGVNHSVGGSIKSDKIAIFQQFKNLVKNAEYAFSTKNEAHSNINKRIGGRIDWDCFVALAKIGDEKYPVVFKIRTIDKDIRSQIYEMASKKEADGSHDPGQQNKPLDALSDYGVVPSTSIAEIVAQDGDSVKRSSRDSDGNNLSDQQQEYFRNSKVRDDNGNLKVMYRGGNEEFTVFDRKKSKPSNLYGRGFYFTDSESHAKHYGNAKPFYLNITKPLMYGQNNIKRNQMRKFLEAVAENEDYGLENYGYGSTVESVLRSVWGKGDFEMLFDVNQTAVGDMVAAVELFNEVNGTDYDGLILPSETVTFRSNQAKIIDNVNPTDDPDIRFSMRNSAEETKDLIAVHNLSEEKLMKSLELGGLPMPSIAIVKAKNGHGKFGEISLVFGKDTIDPEIMRSNKVYSGDAWTPTYPRVEYKPNEDVLSSIQKRVRGLVPYEVRSELGSVSLDTDNVAQFLNRYGGSIWEAFKSNDSMKYAYLKENGVDISLPVKEGNLYQYGEVSNDAVRYFSGKLANGLESLDRFQNMSARDLLQEIELKEAVADTLNFDVLRTIEPGTEEYVSYEQNPVFTPDNVSFSDIDRLLSATRTLLNYGVQETIDRDAARKLISDSIDQVAYEKWLKELFSNVVEKEGIRNNKDYFTSSGNRRSFEALHYENNLENVIKAMKESGEKGIGSFGTGSIFGASTTEFGSVDAIKKAEGRLVQLSQEEFDSIRDGFSDRFFELASSLPINRNSFSASDDAANMLIAAVARYKTKSGMDSYLRRESKGWANYNQYVLDDLLELVRDIRQMPTEYFEAKPGRAVGFDEVSAAVIPDNSSEELKSMLAERGISYVEYKSGDDQSRTDALNSIDGVLFSQRNSEENKLQRKNEKLQEDVSNLKELLRLQGTVTGGKMFKPESIRRAANFIMRETGRSLDDTKKAKLEDMLREAYGALSDENVTYDDIVAECTKVAQWLDENGDTEDALDEYASGILSEMKGIPIWLDETQKQEARSLFGSLSEFRSRIAGTYKLSSDGVPLDDIWNGLAIEYPMYFDADASSAGLPGLLVEAIDSLRNTRNTDPYQHMDVDQMMVKVYDGFWKAKKLTTVADRYQKKIDALNQKHEDAMQKISQLKSDQKAAKLSHQQELRETRRRMKQEAADEIAEVTRKYRDQRSASVENRNRTKIRKQIFGLAEKFQKMETAPAKANTAHAPVGLVHSVARFCEIFADSEARAVEYAANRLSAKETEMELMNDLRGPTKTRLKEADAINRQRERLSKQAKAIAEIQERYRKIKDDSVLSMFYDPHVETLVSQLQDQLRDRDIYDMTAKELNSVYDTMNAMMYTITNANRVFSMEKDKTLVGVVKKLGGEISEKKVSHGVIIDAARKYNMWQMSPDTFFNFICGFKKGNEGVSVQKMFSDGSEKMLGVQRDFYRMFRNITEAQDSGKKKYFNQMMKHPMKEMVDWGLTDSAGNPVKTPRDMMLQAYMLLNQEDSFKSIVFGGFKLPDQGRYYKGKIDSAYSSADESALLSSGINGEYGDLLHEIRLRQEQIDGGGLEVETVEQLNREITALQDQAMELVEGATARMIKLRDSIEKLLTDYDREAIDTAKKWYKYTGQLMTDVYLQMYGYKPNLVEDYVPIHRDLSTVKTDIRVGEEGNAFNLENSGFTKDRVNSRAPILLTGFFNELGSQQQRISRYYGFAQVQKDFNRIWNMKVPGSQYTIKGKIAAKYGAGKTILGVSGEQYIEHYIQNVAGVRGGDDILSVFYGNAASATLSLNPRVALSQAASVPTAAAVVGWKSMAKGFAKGLSTSFSKNKRNQLANDSVWFFQRYRGAGGITEIADMKAKGGMWSRAANSKVGKFLFNWCQNMDVFATASMWAMAEDYVQSNGMKATYDGYKAAVEQCYADIIRKSQPNYTVTERSDLLRDSRGGMKLLTMYKTQSNQNFNILLNAIGEYRAAVLANNTEKSAQSAADLKNAKKNLANGITSVTIGGTLSFVLLRALVNFAWAKVKPYKDDDTDELEADDFFLALAKEVGSSFAGMFALGGQLFDIVNSVVSGDRYYGISDSAISTLAAIPESFVNLVQKASDEDKKVGWNDIEKVISSTLTACGVPYKNASSFVDAAKQWYRNLETGTFFRYSDDTTTRQYRGRILKGWNDGDMEKIDDTLLILASRSSKDTDDAVNKDVTHGFANDYLKDQLKKGNIDSAEAVKLLKYIGHDDPDGVVAKWKFQEENPDVENPSSNLVNAYNNRGDIPGDVVIAAYKFKNNSNKEETVKYIQGLKLTAAQKKQLWNLIKGTWKDKDTPWA